MFAAGAAGFLGCAAQSAIVPSGDGSAGVDTASPDTPRDAALALPADAEVSGDAAMPGAATSPDAMPTNAAPSDASDGASPARLYGVTLDDITGLTDSIAALAALPTGRPRASSSTRGKHRRTTPRLFRPCTP